MYMYASSQWRNVEGEEDIPRSKEEKLEDSF